MSGAPIQLASRLRREFDETFAKPAVVEREAAEHLIAIRADQWQLAVRVREIAGITRCPPCTALPGRNAALCGLAGVRGALVAVYSIAALLGATHGPVGGGWIVLCREERSAALFFEELVGYERVRPDEIHVPRAPSVPVNEVVQIGGTNRTLISVPGLLETIRRKSRAGAVKE